MSKKLRLLSLAALLLSGLTVTSCNDDDEATPTDTRTRFTTSMNGAQEKPTPITSSATGNFTGLLAEDTRVLSYTVTYVGMTPTAGHLHKLASTTALTGPVDIGFTSLTSPIMASTTLTADQMTAFKSGLYYANLHTTANPGGEIRGDIK